MSEVVNIQNIGIPLDSLFEEYDSEWELPPSPLLEPLSPFLTK